MENNSRASGMPVPLDKQPEKSTVRTVLLECEEDLKRLEAYGLQNVVLVSLLTKMFRIISTLAIHVIVDKPKEK